MDLIKEELNTLNKYLKESLTNNKNNISSDIYNFIFAKSKRLRPQIIFLFAKALGLKITDKIYHLSACSELLHNSTLIHDDIIDNAQTRRGKLSLNNKLGNNLSVLSGDFLLSLAMLHLTKCDNIECFNTFSHSLKLMCEGEINQHFNLNKIPTIEEYIQKSKNKTAELFKASLVSLFLIEKQPNIQDALNFVENFGIAFQIKDDLTNILQTDLTKPTLSDIYNGNYSAPVIFLQEKYKNIEQLEKEEIISLLNNEEIISKTINLIKEYENKSIQAISFLENNPYKQEIIKLVNSLL